MGARTWPNLTSALLRGEELATADTAWAMGEIMAGNATPVQIAGFAMALRAKGETPAELAGLVEAMLASATPVELPDKVRTSAVDIVGTGGDRANTVNISTMAAVVTAAAGVTVVKHGNRSASSTTGTADLLEHFGIPLDLGPEGVAHTVSEAGIGFCFAARYHPGMRHAAVTRRELGVPTFFNVLGPLTNPARPTAAMVGCFDQRMAPVMAAVFAGRGDSALVVRGEDGLDEFTTARRHRGLHCRGGPPGVRRRARPGPRRRGGQRRGRAGRPERLPRRLQRHAAGRNSPCPGNDRLRRRHGAPGPLGGFGTGGEVGRVIKAFANGENPRDTPSRMRCNAGITWQRLNDIRVIPTPRSHPCPNENCAASSATAT
jgi:anthranilate phosphoribosyltransferase